MNLRTTAEIAIKRMGETDPIATVPITERSVRRFSLMQDDYIQLEFSLDQAVRFAIGDYVDDELFGHFVITKEQMPKYSTSTGGYDYSLEFEAPYMGWRNHIHCLIANDKRMETEWNLTATLNTHAQQIADNVNLIFGETLTENTYQAGETGPQNSSTGYGVSVSAQNAIEVKHLQYAGCDIISAMDKIAEKWSCEWWVTDESVIIGNTRYAHTIHFGKCESGTTAYKFSLGDNVASMDITRDLQTYANLIYVYGGKQNVPESYDRSLVLNVTNSTRVSSNVYTWYDAHRMLKPYMVKGVETPHQFNLIDPSQPEQGSGVRIISSSTPAFRDDYLLRGTINTLLTWEWGETTRPTPPPQVDVSLYINGVQVNTIDPLSPYDDEVVKDVGNEVQDATNKRSTWAATFRFPVDGLPVAPVNGNIAVEVRWSASSGTCTASGTFSGVTATGTSETAQKAIRINYGGAEMDAVFNYGFSDGSVPVLIKTASSVPVNAQVGIAEEYLDIVRVPYSFFTLNYAIGVGLLGERRLHLPLDLYPDRYISTGETDPTRIVEMAVCFDEIYPRQSLVVGSVERVIKDEDIVHEDGSVEHQQWVQYRFTATKEGGGDFLFNTRYIMDGNKLQAVFKAPSGAQSNNLLSGMTFDVGFDNVTQEYTIIRNEDYGLKLPNETLCPTAGDAFFLTGWNPKAIPSLGLVADAEDELADKGEEYLDAIQAGQFTFVCKMMSGWAFDLEAERFIEDEDGVEDNERQPFDSYNDVNFFVSNGYERYTLLSAGSKVDVYHDALPNGHKESRVLGFEFKLDKPYDTPQYTIGETEAYSRLKKIERELTRLS